VALGRALSFQPQILCLDEPLSALDDETRAEMRSVLRTIREATDVTVLHVTHNLSDARQLADVLYLLREGRVVKTDPETRTGNEPPEMDSMAR
jgi:ABC-type sulfate/molybdate transport systems ATPase subunit